MKHLLKIPQILSASHVAFTPELRRSIRRDYPDELDAAVSASKHINAYELRYCSEGLEITGFIVEPKPRRARPCIIYNRGGGPDFGLISKERLFTRLGRLAESGYLVIASQYAGSDGSEGFDDYGGDDLRHVLSLRGILRRYAFADASRIGMFGHSRGGIVTYRSMASVSWVKAAVCLAGSADLYRAVKQRPELKRIYRSTFGIGAKELTLRSAVRWAKRFPAKTPLLLLHGSADWRVSVLDSLDLARELYKHRKPHRLVVFEGGDHSLSEYRDEAYDMATTWFDRYLKGDAPLPNLKLHGP